MDKVVNTDGNCVINKMETTNKQCNERLTFLQERRKVLEGSLMQLNNQLKELCLKEADLTGIIPSEMPLEPGESLPMIRRRVVTAYQLPENLIKDTHPKDEIINKLEMQIQTHANMAEAALELSYQPSASKTFRRQQKIQYQEHKDKLTTLQKELIKIKDKTQQPQHQLQPHQQLLMPNDSFHKQKKKPRPLEQDDNISSSTSTLDGFSKIDHRRRSVRSLRSPIDKEWEKLRDYFPEIKAGHRNANSMYESKSMRKNDAHMKTARPSYYEHYDSDKPVPPYSLQDDYPTVYRPVYYDHPEYKPEMPEDMPRSCYQQYPRVSPQAADLRLMAAQSQHSPSMQSGPYLIYPPCENGVYLYNKECVKVKAQGIIHPNNHYKHHQIQPHQQYEQTSGLGGYWKHLESGESVWCNNDSSWQRDKRFGSLDRGRHRRGLKRTLPSIDSKSATLATTSTNYSEHVRTASIKSPQVITRRSQDNRQLVRTQSLGSVGAQTIDSVWPSDDNSSCESDNRSNTEGLRKQKEKEWVETSLDGPVSPTHSIISRSQSALPSVLSPEDKYLTPSALPPAAKPATPLIASRLSSPAPPIPPPLTPKPPPPPPLEIPAESNPSPRLPDTNLELFNNNIPKNCTVVQAGHCKPYHEETKPFEMADYYKYSTKFKKSPVKQQQQQNVLLNSNVHIQKNLNASFDRLSIKNHNVNLSQQQMSPKRLDNTNSLNSSLDLSQLSNANVAERFSDEMNAWYKSQPMHQIDNNGGNSNAAKDKSTATLV